MQDGGSPPRIHTELLTVNVLRNLNPPAFTSESYSKEILETLGIGQSVIRIEARDADRKVNNIRYNYTFINFFVENKQTICREKRVHSQPRFIFAEPGGLRNAMYCRCFYLSFVSHLVAATQ